MSPIVKVSSPPICSSPFRLGGRCKGSKGPFVLLRCRPIVERTPIIVQPSGFQKSRYVIRSDNAAVLIRIEVKDWSKRNKRLGRFQASTFVSTATM